MASHTFLSVEDSSSVCRKLIVFLNFLPENDYTYFLSNKLIKVNNNSKKDLCVDVLRIYPPSELW